LTSNKNQQNQKEEITNQMHRYSNSRGTVGENVREFRSKIDNLGDALNESVIEMQNLDEALAYVNEAVGEGKADLLVEEVAGAKLNAAKIALHLESELPKLQKLISDSKRIAGQKYLREAEKPRTIQA
jgi:hypothetical protein